MNTQGYLSTYAVPMRHALLVTLLLLTACATNSTDSSSTVATTSRPGPSTTTTTTVVPGIGCPQDGEFVGVGRIGRISQPASDSKTLGLISRQVVDGCETFGFDFETAENAPATTPPSVDAEFLRGERIIRIHIEIDQTVITDQLVETSLVDRIFVVRALDGSMFIDLHLAAAANARIDVSNSPARLSLELAPRDGEIGPAAAFSDSVVVVSPAGEPVVPEEFTVEGYARTFEATVLILASRGDEVLTMETTTSADWVDTWGEFAAAISVIPGDASLFVGEESPQDGSLRGVILRLTVQ